MSLCNVEISGKDYLFEDSVETTEVDKTVKVALIQADTDFINRGLFDNDVVVVITDSLSEERLAIFQATLGR